MESTDLSICSLVGNVGSFAVKHEDDQIGRRESVAGRQGGHNLHLHLNPYRSSREREEGKTEGSCQCQRLQIGFSVLWEDGNFEL